jgi:TRAP-type C4-dicarboxylate transport system permease small subunit
MKWLEKLTVALNKGLMVLGGIAVLALMLLAGINVLLRLAGYPFSGTYEIVGFLGALVIAFSLGQTQRAKDHIVVDILSSRFPKGLNRVLDSVQYLLTFVFFVAMAGWAFRYGMQFTRSGELSETLKIVYYPFIFCVALGFALLALNLLVDFIQTLVGREDGI